MLHRLSADSSVNSLVFHKMIVSQIVCILFNFQAIEVLVDIQCIKYFDTYLFVSCSFSDCDPYLLW